MLLDGGCDTQGRGDHVTDEENKPTARQAEVLAFITTNARMVGPTVRGIAAGIGVSSPNGVVCHLKALEKKGLIRRRAKISRGIEVVR